MFLKGFISRVPRALIVWLLLCLPVIGSGCGGGNSGTGAADPELVVKGRLIEAGSGLPIAGALITSVSSDDTALTDAQGAFVVTGVRTTELFLHVSASGIDSTAAITGIPADARVLVVELTFDPESGDVTASKVSDERPKKAPPKSKAPAEDNSEAPKAGRPKHEPDSPEDPVDRDDSKPRPNPTRPPKDPPIIPPSTPAPTPQADAPAPTATPVPPTDPVPTATPTPLPPDESVPTIAEAKLYWADTSRNEVVRMNLDGSEAETLLYGPAWPSAVAVDPIEAKIYWSSEQAGKIQRSNLDGSRFEDVIASDLAFPTDLGLDLSAKKMYWIDSGRGVLERSNLDGTVRETLYDLGEKSFKWNGIEIDVPNSRIFWTTGTRIHSGSLNGGASGVILDSGRGVFPMSDLAFDHERGKLYFLSFRSTESAIWRMDPDGNNLERVTSASNFPNTFKFGIRGDILYWLDFHRVNRIDLNTLQNKEVLRPGAIISAFQTHPTADLLFLFSQDRGWHTTDLNGQRWAPLPIVTFMPSDVTVDSERGRLYIAGISGVGGEIERGIQTARLDGSEIESFQTLEIPDPDSVRVWKPLEIEMNASDESVYILDRLMGTLQRAAVYGRNGARVIANLQNSAFGLTIDQTNSRVYWMDHSGAEPGVQSLMPGENAIQSVAGDYGTMRQFWLDDEAQKIYWMADDGLHAKNSDGSGSELLMSLTDLGVDADELVLAGSTFDPISKKLYLQPFGSEGKLRILVIDLQDMSVHELFNEYSGFSFTIMNRYDIGYPKTGR